MFLNFFIVEHSDFQIPIKFCKEKNLRRTLPVTSCPVKYTCSGLSNTISNRSSNLLICWSLTPATSFAVVVVGLRVIVVVAFMIFIKKNYFLHSWLVILFYCAAFSFDDDEEKSATMLWVPLAGWIMNTKTPRQQRRRQWFWKFKRLEKRVNENQKNEILNEWNFSFFK